MEERLRRQAEKSGNLQRSEGLIDWGGKGWRSREFFGWI